MGCPRPARRDLSRSLHEAGDLERQGTRKPSSCLPKDQRDSPWLRSRAGVTKHEHVKLSAYGALALDHLERLALNADRVDWPGTMAAIAAPAARALTPAELHPVILAVARQAGGRTAGSCRRAARRRPGRSRGRAGPCWTGARCWCCCPAPATCGRCAAAGGRALRRHEAAEGWVVELQGNSGYSLWPMLAVAGYPGRNLVSPVRHWAHE